MLRSTLLSFTSLKILTPKNIDSIDDFSEDDENSSHANPLWLIKASAEEGFKEGDRWARYWITEDMLLIFSDGTKLQFAMVKIKIHAGFQK